MLSAPVPGGASRFFATTEWAAIDDVIPFLYEAKAARAERNAGCEQLAEKPLLWSSGDENPGSFQADGTNRAARNNHPTVKPVALMRWLVKLVTPPGGTVCDPFVGSGTTGIAALAEGFTFVGIEKNADYLTIARARILHAVDGMPIALF